jgi:hypothetical protein
VMSRRRDNLAHSLEQAYWLRSCYNLGASGIAESCSRAQRSLLPDKMRGMKVTLGLIASAKLFPLHARSSNFGVSYTETVPCSIHRHTSP